MKAEKMAGKTAAYEPWLDHIKILAAFMVVVLHVGSYIMEFNGAGQYSESVLKLYYAFEAFSYPAIHLFVMAGSWFLLQEKEFKSMIVNRVWKIWSQTFLITVSGMVGLILFTKEKISLLGGYNACFLFLAEPIGL